MAPLLHRAVITSAASTGGFLVITGGRHSGAAVSGDFELAFFWLILAFFSLADLLGARRRDSGRRQAVDGDVVPAAAARRRPEPSQRERRATDRLRQQPRSAHRADGVSTTPRQADQQAGFSRPCLTVWQPSLCAVPYSGLRFHN